MLPSSSIEDNENDSKVADLLSYFQQQFTLQESSIKLCQPELDMNQTHISGKGSFHIEIVCTVKR